MTIANRFILYCRKGTENVETNLVIAIPTCILTVQVDRMVVKVHKLFKIPIELWKIRELIKQFTLRDLDVRYKGSFLGVLWSLLTPLFMLGIYSVVFTQIFRAKWNVPGAEQSNFTLMIFVGMIVYQIFSEPIVRSATIIAGNSNLIKKVVFPSEVLPISVVFSSCINSLLAMAVLIAAVPLTGQQLTLYIFYLPVIWLPLILLTLGLSFFVAVLGAFIRDMNNMVSIIVNAIYFLSPVFYPVSMVPERFQSVMNLNPLTSIIENSRNIILFGQPPAWHIYFYVLAGSLLVFVLGYLFFMHNKELFADAI